ncbi:alpha/beta hydrolase [Pseudanabaena sp. FACHB-2040]|uniref:alpha/beta fold hydrolase n=1 Tax=Pseudanabaena sp. FACHB-2040 TaxID=2692859 RepID=UPI001683E825|nr:alpha/beta hydrolase [Pseudanabaena sp. FACHB-2040]
MNSNSQRRFGQWFPFKATLAGLTMIWGLGGAAPGEAAETLMLRVGPLSQSVHLNDLEHFSDTGEVPAALKLYRPLLTPQLAEALQSRISLDPAISTLVLEEVLRSSSGKQIVQTLENISPSLAPAELQAALNEAALDPDGLSILSVLRAMPEKTVEVNFSALATLASQFNLTRFENASLGRVLEHELPGADAVDAQLALPVDPSNPGPVAVELWELNLRDRNRQRNIPVDLYWSRDTQGPLVVLSHGFGADRRFFAYLAHHLASYGLTVASVEHPGSNVAALISSPLSSSSQETNRILPATEFLDRPEDISFVLDRLASLNESSFSLRGRLNTENVAFIGHSLGGYTGLALAGATLDTRDLQQFCENILPSGLSPADWLQCAALDLPVQTADLSDPRITQLIVMNPLTGQLFGESGFSQIQIPTLVLASSHDGVTPIASQQLLPFEQLAGPKHLVTVIGGTHLSVGDPQNLNPELSSFPFMPELPGEATARLREFLQGVSLSFILQQTDDADQYAAFLTPAYAQAYSTPDLPLRISQELPTSVQRWLKLALRPHQSQGALAYMPSLVHLEAIDIQHRFRALQQQMVAYLRTSPPSLTVVYLPSSLFRSPLHAFIPK